MANDDSLEFYAPWPKLGAKPFNKQLHEIRTDISTMNILARAMGVELDPEAIVRDHILTRWIQGQQGFFNKYSTFFDKTDGSWNIQRNTGTTITPVWGAL